MSLWQRMMCHYWESQAVYLRMRIEELKAEQHHLRADQEKAEYRLKRAETRLVQYAQVPQ